MQPIMNLPANIIHSLHNFYHSNLVALLPFKDMNDSNLINSYAFLEPYYCEWMNHVKTHEEDIWSSVGPLKNNLPFILSVFEQFNHEERENKKKSKLPSLSDYYTYANGLYLESFGLPLEDKQYTRNDLINIIKDCEKRIKILSEKDARKRSRHISH